MRYFLHFAYNGTHYHGWQIQPNAKSVQGELNFVLSKILKQPIELMGAGRTDTGVHAKQMFAHFDVDFEIDKKNILHKINSFLAKDIAVFDVILVSNTAHARFDALSRTYQYHITLEKPIFESNLSWHFTKKLNINAMNQAAKILLDYTNFKCFSKSNSDVFTYNCKITEAFWEQKNNELIFTISANRFLRNMVRAIVGTLVNIGLHKISENDFINIIKSENREKAGFSVPAEGLFLTKIEYPYIATNESI